MSFLNHWLLTILLAVPLIGALAVRFVRHDKGMRWTALGAMLLTFVLSLLILIPFKWRRGGAYDYGSGGTVQLSCRVPLVPAIHADYHVAIDGLSFPFVLLTTFMFPLVGAASWKTSPRPATYFALLLFLEWTLLGTFVAFDLVLFYVFATLSVLPACALVALWGGADAGRAALRMLLHMAVGLACLLVVLVGLHVASRHVFAGGTFDLVRLAGPQMQNAFSSPQLVSMGTTLFLLAMIGFVVRLGAAPLHLWLPDVLAEAPAPVAMALVALIPGTGAYGILRIAMPLFAKASGSLWTVFAVLGVASILYGALCALAQDRIRRLIAYGAVAMMGFVLLGASVRTATAAEGAVFALLSNGLICSLLLLVMGDSLRDAVAPEIGAIGGLDTQAAIRTTFFTLGWLAWLVVPGLLAQFLVLIGTAARADSAAGVSGPGGSRQAYALIAAAGIGVMLIGAAAVRMLYRVFSAQRPRSASTADVPGREIAVMSMLSITTILLGLLPTPMCFTFTHRAVHALLRFAL